MFLVHASDDDEPGAQPEQSLALYRALRDAGVPAELHIYDEGGHGFGVRKTGRPVSNWSERCAEWLKQRGILPAGVHGNKLASHDRPPRKVIVGTTMTRWYGDYPGLERAARADASPDRPDGGGIALEVWPVHRPGAFHRVRGHRRQAGHRPPRSPSRSMTRSSRPSASKAREHNTYIVFGGVFRDDPGQRPPARTPPS